MGLSPYKVRRMNRPRSDTATIKGVHRVWIANNRVSFLCSLLSYYNYLRSEGGEGNGGSDIPRRRPRQECDAVEEAQHRPFPCPLQREILRRRHCFCRFHQARFVLSFFSLIFFNSLIRFLSFCLNLSHAMKLKRRKGSPLSIINRNFCINPHHL